MLEPELESALRRNPQEELTRLFNEQRPALRQFISARIGLALRGRVDPSDVVQDTLIEAFQRLEHYLDAPKVSFSRWLYTLAEQNAITAHRRHAQASKRSVHRESKQNVDNSKIGVHASAVTKVADDPLQRIQELERVAQLQQAIRSLSIPSQTVIRMRFLEGRPMAEIAEHLGISTDAVTKRALRSLRKLGRAARELGISSSE